MWSAIAGAAKMGFKKLAKHMAKKAAKKNPKSTLKFLIALIIFILVIPILIYEGIKHTILCTALGDCGGVDKELVQDNAAYLTEVRNKAYDKLENKDSNEKFLSAEEVNETFLNSLDEEAKENMNFQSQAEMFLRILLVLDQEVYMQTSTKDFKKGKRLDNTIIDKSLSISKKQYKSGFIKFFLSDKFKEKDYKSKKETVLLNYRLSVYICYFTDNCDDDAEGSLPEGIEKGAAILNDKTNFDNATINSLFEKFYEISFFKAAEGKIAYIPEGKGLEMFNEKVAEYTSRFNEMYPSTVPGVFMNSFGWLVPLEDGTYHKSSPYGPRGGELHKGTDLGAPDLTPIYAAKSGVVSHMVKNEESAGSTIVIDHQDGFSTLYFHMKAENRLVEVGQVVKQGQMIGGVGNEGYSTAAHLHFEICTKVKKGGFCENGYNIDPEEEGYYKGMFTSAKNNAKMQAGIALFEKEKANPDRKKNPTMMPGFSGIANGLGSISFKYEGGSLDFAGCDNNAVNGKITCGPWQIQGTSFQGEFQDWLKKNYPIYHQAFVGNTKSAAKADAAYKKLLAADKENWLAAQHQYIYETHYVSIIEYLKKNAKVDFSTRSRPIQEMIWSSGVQERYDIYRGIIAPLQKKGYDFNKMTDVEVLYYFYKQRLVFHTNKSVHNYANRFIAEYYDTIDLLNTGTFNPKKFRSYKLGTPFPPLTK